MNYTNTESIGEHREKEIYKYVKLNMLTHSLSPILWRGFGTSALIFIVTTDWKGLCTADWKCLCTADWKCLCTAD